MKKHMAAMLITASLGLASCLFMPEHSDAGSANSQPITAPKAIRSESGNYNPTRSFAPPFKP